MTNEQRSRKRKGDTFDSNSQGENDRNVQSYKYQILKFAKFWPRCGHIFVSYLLLVFLGVSFYDSFPCRKRERTQNQWLLWGESKRRKYHWNFTRHLHSAHWVPVHSKALMWSLLLSFCLVFARSSTPVLGPVASLLVAVALAPVLPGVSPCWCTLLHSIHCLILW